METLKDQPCPICMDKKGLTLTQDDTEVPYFGKVFVFSMSCTKCKYHKADIEVEAQREGAKYTLEVARKEDLKIRVIRSSEGSIDIPRVGSLEPGENAEGFVSNVEGVLQRFQKQIEHLRDSAEDIKDKKKAKNLLKKLQKVLWGEESITISVKDKSGNSAIVSDKAKIDKIK